MARPKRVESTESARQRIEEAYWELLEEMPYSRITISKLSRKAAVNHNLIYYYYENIDDLAEKTFIKNVESGQPQMMISALLTSFASNEARTAGVLVSPSKPSHFAFPNISC